MGLRTAAASAIGCAAGAGLPFVAFAIPRSLIPLVQLVLELWWVSPALLLVGVLLDRIVQRDLRPIAWIGAAWFGLFIGFLTVTFVYSAFG